LGLGDVKFFAVAGLWLGWEALPDFCVVSGLTGLVLGIIWKKITGQPSFPFGPALIFSFYLLFLMGGSLFV